MAEIGRTLRADYVLEGSVRRVGRRVRIAAQLVDAGDETHAWAEVLIPGAGWRGFDATLQLVADATYVAVAVGRDGQDAAPQRGSFKGEEAGEPPLVNLQIMRQQ